MSSLFDHGSIRTAAVQQVVAPIASHLCHLVLLCDSEEEPEQFGRLEAAAQALAKATENMAAVASRHMSETDDEVLHMGMASLLEPVTVSGQHVLLAAQKLSIQPGLGEHREELITATQNVFLKVVEVLLVDDEATVRRVVAAADQVLEQLSELGSSSDMKSLLRSFRVFSEALCALHSLTVERADSLQDPTQSKQLLDSLETLRKCISMLRTAMCTTIKHPTSEPAQAAKRFILDKVQSTVGDIIMTLKGEFPRSSQSPFGYYTERRTSLLQILTSSPTSSVRSSGFDIMVRDLVFHCMLVANYSRREFHQKLVCQCRHILQFWSDIKRILKSSDDPDEQSLENTFILLVQQIHMLDNTLIPTILYQVLDTFSTAFSTFEELSNVMRQIMLADNSIKMDLNFIQALIEDFISSTDRIIQVANFISAVAVDTKSLENIENSRACLTRLRDRIAPLSLELADNAMQTALKLHDVCQKWEEETTQLQDALSDVMDVREFTNIAIHEMVNDRHGCDSAYREQSYKLFNEHATNLICHLKLVIQSVRRHLDRSDNPIYRNGLRVLLKQVQTSQTKVEEAVKDMLLGSQLNVEAYSTFSDSVSRVIQHFKVLREGLDGEQHPHLLSPLRERVHQPEIPKLCSPVKEACELTRDHIIRGSGSALWELMEGGSHAEQVEEYLNEETTEAEVPHKNVSDDLKIPAISAVPKLIHKPLEFDLLPLLYKVMTVTKEKDVTMLNQACTGVLELSNCFAQAAKEALAIVDAVDCQTLESFRAELVSLTQLLVQAAQETAMSSAMSTESIYKYSTQFSDLINNIKKVLLPVAGTWYHAVHSALQENLPTVATTVTQQLNDVMRLCADMVQLLTSSDLTSHDSEETFSSLHHKLNKAQNNTSSLVEISVSLAGHTDKLEGLCILWGLSIQILLNSLDKILGTSTVMNHLRPQKQLSVLSENSLRLQEAARITSLSCRSAYKSKQLRRHQDELKILSEAYLKAAEELAIMPSLMQLAKSEFFQRHVLIKMRVLSGHLSKANTDYDAALKNIVSIAYFAAEHFRKNNAEDSEQKFGKAAQAFVENVESVTKIVEDCLNYISDPRARSNLRSMNDHMSFQISDIISRARLILETQYICDMLTLDVQIQCWSAKAHYMVEEIRKQDGIHPEAKEQIRAGLQGKTFDDVEEVLAAIPPKVKEESVKNFNMAARAKMALPKMEKDDRTRAGANKTSSLTYTSIFLKQESDSWDTKNNRIVQVTRKMADTICCMTQYLKKKGPIPDKEAFVNAAKDVISNCQSVTQFIRIIANHCLDKQCMVELSLIVEQILTITNQLNIISSVNAVTPGCKSSDEILVKNAQNLLQTVLCGVRAAETACITGLKQPEPNSDGAEATALCFQWKKNLDIHRAQQTCNPETDELGLRKTSSHLVAPSLISPVTVQNGYS